MKFLKRLFYRNSFNVSKVMKTNQSHDGIDRSQDLIIIRDFNICINGGMKLTRGQKARYIYEEDDWFYVESSRGSRGFVPKSYFRGRYNEGISRLSSYSSYHEKDLYCDEDNEYCQDEVGISEGSIDDLFIIDNQSSHICRGQSSDDSIETDVFEEAAIDDFQIILTSTPIKTPHRENDKNNTRAFSNRLHGIASLIDLHSLHLDDKQTLYFV